MSLWNHLKVECLAHPRRQEYALSRAPESSTVSLIRVDARSRRRPIAAWLLPAADYGNRQRGVAYESAHPPRCKESPPRTVRVVVFCSHSGIRRALSRWSYIVIHLTRTTLYNAPLNSLWSAGVVRWVDKNTTPSHLFLVSLIFPLPCVGRTSRECFLQQ